MKRGYWPKLSGLEEIDLPRRTPSIVLISTLLGLLMLLGACGDSGGQPVVDVNSSGQGQTQPTASVSENDAMTETLEAAESSGITQGTESESQPDDITVITDTELITGTEVTTNITVNTDTVVLEQQLITTVVTDTALVTNVVESTDSSTTTQSEVITNTEDISPSTTSGQAQAEVAVTPLAPTATPTIVVEVTRVVTDTQVVTDTIETTAVATPQPGQAQTSAAGATTFAGLQGATGKSILASTLLDADFQTTDGEVGGEIQDIVVDIQNGQILYVLLEYGGVLDVGDTDMPVPLSAFSWNDEDQLALNIPGDQLENFPGVGNDWPVADSNDWDTDIRNFWQGVGVDAGFDAQQSMQGVRRVSNLISGPITGGNFGNASVQDMLISLGEGRVTYLLVADDAAGTDMAAANNGWYIIPFSALDAAAAQDGFALNANFDPALLEQSPRFNAADFAQTNVFEDGFDSDWQGYWGDAGYPVTGPSQ